jgi:MoxR-like ATPase
VFTQLLLADEINRASPKARALLEAMEENGVSIDGIGTARTRSCRGDAKSARTAGHIWAAISSIDS